MWNPSNKHFSKNYNGLPLPLIETLKEPLIWIKTEPGSTIAVCKESLFVTPMCKFFTKPHRQF